jgi:hypothetical protein
LQSFCNGFAADHTFQAGLILVVGTNSVEVLELFRRTLHAASQNVYMMCPPSGWVSPCMGFPWAMTPMPTPVPMVI